MSFLVYEKNKYFCKNFFGLIRIVENNNWVFISIFISILVLVLSFFYLNREVTLKEFITQKIEEASNVSLTWLVVSVVFCLQISVLFSQYVPILPRWIEELSIAGYSLNKFGYIFLIFSSFYLVRFILTLCFYSSIGHIKNIEHLQFSASRFYFFGSIVMMVLVFVNYFLDLDKQILLPILLAIQVGIFVFKLISYFVGRKENLPTQWYYKLLYICTLQILPLFALWRLVFFN